MSFGTRAKGFEDGQKAGEKLQRPEYVTHGHLEYLDELRESGETNMYGARSYIQSEFPDLTEDEAAGVLGYWMETFGNPSR